MVKYYFKKDERPCKTIFEFDGALTSEYLYVFSVCIEKWNVRKFFIERIDNKEEAVQQMLKEWAGEWEPIAKDSVEKMLKDSIRELIR